jgi:hypothetical protein
MRSDRNVIATRKRVDHSLIAKLSEDESNVIVNRSRRDLGPIANESGAMQSDRKIIAKRKRSEAITKAIGKRKRKRKRSSRKSDRNAKAK